MFINHILKFLGQSPEGKLWHPDADLEILDDKTTDDNNDNNDNNEDKDDKDKKDDKEEVDEEADVNDNKDEDEEDDEDTEDNEEEENEDDNEDTEETDDTDDDKEIVTRWTDLKAKYPDINKEFPDIKNALFRAQAFSEVFGSVKEAETAKGRSDSLAAIEEDLLVNADPSKLLSVIKKNSEESLEGIAFKTLEFLQEADKDLYYEVAAIPIKQLLRGAFKKGGTDNEGKLTNLGKAVYLLHRYYFDNDELAEKVKGEGGLPRCLIWKILGIQC
jgi:hypothetical protein